MLAVFRFKNFRSFKGEAEMSLVASPADKSLNGALIAPFRSSASKVRLLPAAAIYGSNAAGKTNVLQALRFMSRAVTMSQSGWSPTQGIPLKSFKGPGGEQTSLFEVEIILEEVRYKYGFTTSSDEILEEWLLSYPNNKPRQLFVRKAQEDDISVKVGKHFENDSRYISALKRRIRKNSLFLSAAAQDNHEISLKVYEFFNRMMTSSLDDRSIDRSSVLTSTLMEVNDSWKASLLEILKTSDSSISDVVIEPEKGKTWKDHRKENSEDSFFSDPNRYKVDFVVGEGSQSFIIPFNEQSEGIKRLYGLFGEIIASLFRPTVILVDELESSIHPHVARLIVDIFQSASDNKFGSQILFTTHDTNLLDQSLLRRDQIWLVEKESCCSKLYSLLDFAPRNDADLERGYLRGKYGAIPSARLPVGWLDVDILADGE